MKRIADWIERHDRALTAAGFVFVLASAVYIAGSVALR